MSFFDPFLPASCFPFFFHGIYFLFWKNIFSVFTFMKHPTFYLPFKWKFIYLNCCFIPFISSIFYAHFLLQDETIFHVSFFPYYSTGNLLLLFLICTSTPVPQFLLPIKMCAHISPHIFPVGKELVFTPLSRTQKIGRQPKPPANADLNFASGQSFSAPAFTLRMARRSVLEGLCHGLENLVVIKRLIYKSLGADLTGLIDGVVVGQGRDHQYPGIGMVL